MVSLGDTVNCLGNIFHIIWGEGHNGETTIFGHVNAVVFLEQFHLVCGEPCVAEHAYLLRNVRPVASGA